MESFYLKNIESIYFADDVSPFSYGLNQEWYSTIWKRQAGCGPTIASTIHCYLTSNRSVKHGKDCSNHKQRIELMNLMWSYITPTLSGVSNIRMFQKKFQSFTQEQQIISVFDSLNVVKQKNQREPLKKVINFISQAIMADCPVAFLNLDHGNQTEIDSWHWTIIVGIAQTKTQLYEIDVLDNGTLKKLNLSSWYQTTRLGGGFVSVDYIAEKI